MLLFFISSGIFLGWSLGANDGANVFGTAVGSRMLRFRTAALVAGIFVVVGAVVQGAGATGTLTSLGGVDALAGSFTVALCTALVVYFMTRYAIPVSTSQAIVGGIIGWNLYTNNPTDFTSLRNIVLTWVSSPVLGAIFAVLFYITLKGITNNIRLHLLYVNKVIKTGLMLVGAFGAYSLGANNIANVMGVFVPSVDLTPIELFWGVQISGAQQLFFLGGIAIAAGIATYSRRVMERVGNQMFKLSAESAIVVVLAHSLVLFIFSSKALQEFIVSLGLPAIPLVPVSSSQVIVGAILGIGIWKGARGIQFKIVGQIAAGWIITPVASALLTFLALFFVNNVFDQKVQENPAENEKEILQLNLNNKGFTGSNCYFYNP